MTGKLEKKARKNTLIATGCILAILALVSFYAYKTSVFKAEEATVKNIEKAEEKGLFEVEQKKSQLSLLKSNSTIEQKALEMGMHKAATDEIVRIEIKKD